MDGRVFYLQLRIRYQNDGQYLFKKYSFCRWIQKRDGTFSFQFSGCKPKKSVPESWIILAKNEMNKGFKVDRRWFKDNIGADDCRVSVANWLLENH